MRQTVKMNAIRSGIVVVGTLAFGYLTLQLGFKPFLERAQASLNLNKSDSKPFPNPDPLATDLSKS